MQELVALLKSKHLTIASCESLTGGLFASKVVDISGASAVFMGALVTYATPMKVKLAHVDEVLIKTYGVVSREVAQAMAVNTREITGSDIAVSFTGNAGPSTLEDKPAGLVYTAIAWCDGCLVYEDRFQGSREEIRLISVAAMVQRLKSVLTQTILD